MTGRQAVRDLLGAPACDGRRRSARPRDRRAAPFAPEGGTPARVSGDATPVARPAWNPPEAGLTGRGGRSCRPAVYAAAPCACTGERDRSVSNETLDAAACRT